MPIDAPRAWPLPAWIPPLLSLLGALWVVVRYALLVVLHVVLLAVTRAALMSVCLGAFVLAPRPVAAEEPVQLEAPAVGARARVKKSKRAKPATIASTQASATTGEGGGSFFHRLARDPLDPPLNVTGGFGEYRAGHFHAGLDFGTGEVTGKPVYAPADGWIARVRTSGVGYGRSLYLQAHDGRLLQFGHLDAFAEPVATWVAAAQDSSGQYEQDLWPAARKFAVKHGDVIAWTGQSGAGGPHLHFEVRRGDTAFHPFRAGLRMRDDTAPTISSVTLEPLDDASFVERCAAPHTLRFAARRDTLVVEGRVRAVVNAADAVGSGPRRIEPWSIAMEFDGRKVECRFDSLSWATDMPEGDYIFDAGRIANLRGIVLWSPAGFRPRALLADVGPKSEAGTIEVRANDPPRRLTLVARDVAGRRETRVVVLRAPRPWERGLDPTRPGGRATAVAAHDRFEFTSLPHGFWRVIYRGAPRLSRGVVFEVGEGHAAFAASTGGADWTAVIPRAAWGAPFTVRGRDASDVAWSVEGPAVTLAEGDAPGSEAKLSDAGWGVPAAESAEAVAGESAALASDLARGFRWSLPRDARFEPGAVGQNLRPAEEDAPAELALVAIVGRLEPEGVALRKPARVVQSLAGVADTRVGLYRAGRGGWDHLTSKRAADGASIEAESRRLGTFALFADTLAPRIAPRAARGSSSGRYSRWALEARVTEEGSGLDARATYFEVDGVRVPSEWDGEEKILRWRPQRPPAPGEHRYTVVTTDRAGNVARAEGTFTRE